MSGLSQRSPVVPQHAAASSHDNSVMVPPSPTAGGARSPMNSYVVDRRRMVTRSQARLEQARQTAIVAASVAPGSSSPPPSSTPPPSKKAQLKKVKRAEMKPLDKKEAEAKKKRHVKVVKSCTPPTQATPPPQVSSTPSPPLRQSPLEKRQPKKVKKVEQKKMIGKKETEIKEKNVQRIVKLCNPPAPTTPSPKPLPAPQKRRAGRPSKKAGADRRKAQKTVETLDEDVIEIVRSEASVPPPQHPPMSPPRLLPRSPPRIPPKRKKRKAAEGNANGDQKRRKIQIEQDSDRSIVEAETGNAGQTAEGNVDESPVVTNTTIVEKVNEKGAKKIRFNRNVQTFWLKRTMAQSDADFYFMTGEQNFESVTRLKGPSSIKPPKKITADEMVDIGDDTDFENLPLLENPPQRRGCTDTCTAPARTTRSADIEGSKKYGCSDNCSCRKEGLECSSYFDCPCTPDCCDQWNTNLIEVQTDEARQAEVAAANRKTEDWPERQNSTLSSENTFLSDQVAVVVRENTFDDLTESLEKDESEEVVEEDIEEMVPTEPPACTIDSVCVSGEREKTDDDFGREVNFDERENADEEREDSGDEVEEDEDEEKDGDEEEEDSEPESSDDGSSSDDGDVNNEQINMKPSEFSQDLLNLLPMMLDQREVDTCRPGKWIGGDALFAGLLRVATAHNNYSKVHERRAAVLHPTVFVEALRIASEEAEEVVRRRLAKDRRPMVQLPQLDAARITQSVAYGHNWTEMIIPMSVRDGHHWVVAVVQRATASVVIYDSLKMEASATKDKKKEFEKERKLCKEALRKILIAVQDCNQDDTTTGRFKVRFARHDYCNLQSDGFNCGVYSILHAERALLCKNSNLRIKIGEPRMNIADERKKVLRDAMGLHERFQRLAKNNTPLTHGPNGGQKEFQPGGSQLKRVLRSNGKI